MWYIAQLHSIIRINLSVGIACVGGDPNDHVLWFDPPHYAGETRRTGHRLSSLPVEAPGQIWCGLIDGQLLTLPARIPVLGLWNINRNVDSKRYYCLLLLFDDQRKWALLHVLFYANPAKQQQVLVVYVAIKTEVSCVSDFCLPALCLIKA